MELSRPIYRLRRQARLLSRTKDIPLHAALDLVAEQEGFSSWSLLVARLGRAGTRESIFTKLSSGDLVLIGGRPGHGKTLLALEIALDARREGRRAWFFTLEFTDDEVAQCVAAAGIPEEDVRHTLQVDTSDEICARYIAQRLAEAESGTVVVVDYLQLLDQKRVHDNLDEQMRTLAQLAARRGLIVICISQVDRRFDVSGRRMPTLDDIRRPNPINVAAFTKACFIHEGRVALRAVNYAGQSTSQGGSCV